MFLNITAFSGLTAMQCFAETKQPEEILLVGDSIAEGYLLAGDEKNYGEIIGEYYGDGTNIENIAVSGYTTTDLLNQIADDNYKSLYENADIIIISIGANDMLSACYNILYSLTENLTSDDVSQQVNTDTLSGIIDEIKKGTDTAIRNFPVIISKIRELNSNAEIIFQTIYSPFEALKSNDYYSVLLSLDFVLTRLLSSINSAIITLDDVNVANVRSRFKNNGWLLTNINEYDIHPNQFGHIAIASEILADIDKTDRTKDYKYFFPMLSLKYLSDEHIEQYRSYAMSADDSELLTADKILLQILDIDIPEPTSATTSESLAEQAIAQNSEQEKSTDDITNSESTIITETETITKEESALTTENAEQTVNEENVDLPKDKNDSDYPVLITLFASACALTIFISVKNKKS